MPYSNTPKINPGKEDKDMSIFNKNLRTYNNDNTDDDFSEKGLTTTAKRRNSWSTSRMSPFTENKNVGKWLNGTGACYQEDP